METEQNTYPTWEEFKQVYDKISESEFQQRVARRLSLDPAIIESDRRFRLDNAACNAIDPLIGMLQDIHDTEGCSPAERRTIRKQFRLCEELMEKAGWFAKKNANSWPWAR